MKTNSKTKEYLQQSKNTVSTEKTTKGITLIALVITIIVLLILARSNNCDANRTEWNINKCNKCK